MHKLKAEKKIATIDIFFDNKPIDTVPKLIVFVDASGKKETIIIYSKSFCKYLVIEEKKFKHPIIIENQIKVYDFYSLEKIFLSPYPSFQIMDKEIPDYEKFFNQEEVVDKIFLLYNPNLKYYFNHIPKEQKRFKYNYSILRNNLLEKNTNEKINAICGILVLVRQLHFYLLKQN